MAKLLTTAYFPPVSYFAAIAEDMKGLVKLKGGDRKSILPSPLSSSVIYIEACENYQKQSYRNRCHFYAADGLQSLSFPIIHDAGSHKHPISEVRIDYSKPWVIQHQRAIISAYRTSAYFEYYQDELFEILDSRPEKLIDLNTRILKFFIDKTGLMADIRMTDEFRPDGYIVSSDGMEVKCEDLRESIHPKREDRLLKDLRLEKPYFQVFAEKHGFIPNLSIMDLLFNEGPDSIMYLKNL
ncbi:MAG: WbqC family protein [Bacteroidales bacterium]|nr:WbqC family protein [Bacteroidales bacterium]